MGKSNIPKHISDRMKQIIAQTTGKFDNDKDEEFEFDLLPEYNIKGTGIIYCTITDNRTFVKIERGTGVYIIEENFNQLGKHLVYCMNGEIVLIEQEQLEKIGYD